MQDGKNTTTMAVRYAVECLPSEKIALLKPWRIKNPAVRRAPEKRL
jgi:hypothetical protein